MDKQNFLEKIGKLFDADAHFNSPLMSSAQRTFTEAERTEFLQHLYEFFAEQETDTDFESVEFILALQGVKKKYGSVQDQAAHLGEALKIVRAALKVNAPAVAQVP